MRNQNVQPAQYDHFWDDRGTSPSAERQRRQLEYYNELKKQIEEKNQAKKAKNISQEMTQYTPERQVYDRKSNYYSETYNNNTRDRRNQNNENISYYSEHHPTISNSISGENQFAQTLLSKFDEQRRSSNLFSQTQPIQSVSVSQPIPTFATTTTKFEISGFEKPSLSPPRQYDRKRIKPITMHDAVSVRSSLERTDYSPPIIKRKSPFERSRVATPSTGFSFKSKKTNASFPDRTEYSTLNSSSITDSNMASYNNIVDQSSMMIYQNGEVMPL